jgi:hypothetical protein
MVCAEKHHSWGLREPTFRFLNMTKRQQLAEKVREVTAWIVENKGCAFAGWPSSVIFKYVAFHAISGTIFIKRIVTGQIEGVAFAWPVESSEAVKSPFDWTLPRPGTCLLISEVVTAPATRRARVVKWLWDHAPERWPTFDTVLTWRHGKIHELRSQVMERYFMKGAV